MTTQGELTAIEPKDNAERLFDWRQRLDALIGTDTEAANTLSAKGSSAKRVMLQITRNRAAKRGSIQNVAPVDMIQIAERFGDDAKAPTRRMILVAPLKIRPVVQVVTKRHQLRLAC